MPIPIRITVEEPDALLDPNSYGAGGLIHLEGCATKTGTFADVGKTALVAGQRSYLFWHDAPATTWYRSRFEDAAGTIPLLYTEGWSQPFQVGASAGLADLAGVRQRLGLAVTDTTSDEDLAEFIEQVTRD